MRINEIISSSIGLKFGASYGTKSAQGKKFCIVGGFIKSLLYLWQIEKIHIIILGIIFKNQENNILIFRKNLSRID